MRAAILTLLFLSFMPCAIEAANAKPSSQALKAMITRLFEMEKAGNFTVEAWPSAQAVLRHSADKGHQFLAKMAIESVARKGLVSVEQVLPLAKDHHILVANEGLFCLRYYPRDYETIKPVLMKHIEARGKTCHGAIHTLASFKNEPVVTADFLLKLAKNKRYKDHLSSLLYILLSEKHLFSKETRPWLEQQVIKAIDERDIDMRKLAGSLLPIMGKEWRARDWEHILKLLKDRDGTIQKKAIGSFTHFWAELSEERRQQVEVIFKQLSKHRNEAIADEAEKGLDHFDYIRADIAKRAKTADDRRETNIISFNKWRWTASDPSWTDPTSLKILEKRYEITIQAGDKTKGAIQTNENWPWDRFPVFEAIIDNKGGEAVSVALALKLGKEYTYYESPAMTIAANGVSDISLNTLKTKFKSAASDWAFTAELPTDSYVNEINFIIYHQGSNAHLRIEKWFCRPQYDDD